MPTEKTSWKTVLITGGGTGIGLETARYLLKHPDYRLALLGKSQDNLSEAIHSLGGPSDRLVSYVCDLRDPRQIRNTVEKISDTFRELYGLINNAGIYPFGNLQTTTLDAWNETLNINLTASFVLSQTVAPLMAKTHRKGRIINVSSTAGILPNHFALAYSVSKAALNQLTRTLAKELGKEGITVNCVCPGIVKSPMHEAYHPNRTELEQFYAKRGSAYPMGRVGEPGDIAGAIEFLLSDQASWLTGDLMIIDGGRLLT